jgi:hypothetical protein
MYTGPHLIKDELVFGYDSGYGVADNHTATRFYKGEPTTNAVPLVDFLDTSNWTGSGWSGSIVVSTDYPNTLELTSTNGWRTYCIDTGITSGGTVSFSYEYRGKSIDNPSSFMMNLNGTHLGSYTNGLGNGTNADLRSGKWIKVTKTWTANSDSKVAIGSRGSDGYGLSDVVYVRNFQVELNGHATPYTESSRSATASLINLGSSGDINVNTISFDSTGQPTFDGTDDKIIHNPGTFPRDFKETFSIEVIYYVPASASWSGVSPARNSTILARGSYGGVWGLTRFTTNNRLGFYMRTGTGQVGSNLDPYYTIERDKYYHIVATWNGSTTATLYVNGVSVSTDSITTVGSECDNTGNILIGGGTSFSGSNGGYVEAKIPVAKVFKKCLTATEVKQNFRAYENRFNI